MPKVIDIPPRVDTTPLPQKDLLRALRLLKDPCHVGLMLPARDSVLVEILRSLDGSLIPRKHHCRKCGRVVCASCSPHRITIPRQFIVQPPQDSNMNPGNGVPANIEVVDLTGNDDDQNGQQQSSGPRDTPQSPVSRIDPALGGGQEVRLCNPCVPDPNPLPHLPFDPPSPFRIDSFESLGAESPSTPGHNHQVSSFSRRLSAAQRNFNPSDRAGLNRGDEAADTTHGARSLQRFPPIPPQRLTRYNTPPNYSALYGSVPNPSLND
ncbi:MAG: hypothetical protein Q9183_001095, partial [Haloplaca sp. 2 TL-2023]